MKTQRVEILIRDDKDKNQKSRKGDMTAGWKIAANGQVFPVMVIHICRAYGANGFWGYGLCY